ncbi:hypothetical protein EU803_14915 [Loktanella sp. IMCC34160]|uniref:hypothetical protein n=1 Tax=Loktanella sp. IMCC34160 TaxID=2510646 RepID=UPI00101DD4C7|nr:hypothetical protein [Loktanella sp. IMCC34160]RYG89912.1 hypothetical protein EU803_14915 [Loktanella sp. IMCC34160]
MTKVPSEEITPGFVFGVRLSRSDRARLVEVLRREIEAGKRSNSRLNRLLAEDGDTGEGEA